jgi:hypothetical protein
MPQRLVQILTILLAFVTILGFAGIYGFEIYKAFARPCQTSVNGSSATSETKADPQDIKDPYTYVATALAGLVGGVVAVLFGQPLPKSASDVNFWKAVLLTAYSSVYLLTGVVSVFAWIAPKACPSILIKTLALTFLGLLVPIVASFFKQNSITGILGWKHELPGS